MVTVSRAIVVLRSELAEQLKLAHKRFYKAQEEHEKDRYNNQKSREMEVERNSVFRVKAAMEALGSLTLGDIEDREEFKL